MLNGIGVSSSIAIGRVVKFVEDDLHFAELAQNDIASEKQRFSEAVDEFCLKAGALARKMDGTDADGQILRGYAVMINDPYLNEHITKLLECGKSAEWAVQSACDAFIQLFTDSTDELVRHRAADIEDIKRQMLEILLHIECEELEALPENTILVTDELTPSMTVALPNSGVVGIVAEKGGRTSHAAIIARSLGLPTVLGCKGAISRLSGGETVAIDGETGEVFKNGEDGFARLKDKQKNQPKLSEEYYKSFVGKSTVTADGSVRKIVANIDSPRDIEAVLKSDAEGVGLFRTEGFFLDRGVLPTEDEQTAAYRAVAEAMNGKEVVIRTLDVGGDKNIPSVHSENEDNPFLGLRAIRYSIKNQGLFRTQLRAILRASAFGNISLLIPLVTRVDELLYVKNLLKRLKSELDAEGVAYKKDMKVGVMIETPAAICIADILAENADFFSIGTNDLIGYTMAVDRGNPKVSYLYSAYEPAVLRSVKRVIEVAKQKGIRCSMCGEAAADEKLLPLLLSFGLDEFSVMPSRVLPLRAKIATVELSHCDLITAEAMTKTRARAVEGFLSE